MTWWESEPLRSISRSATTTITVTILYLAHGDITDKKRIEILHCLQSQPISSEAFQPEFPVFPRKSYVPLVYYFTETVTLGATFIGSLTIWDDNNKENVEKDKLILSPLPDNDVKLPNMTFYAPRSFRQYY